MGMKDIWLTILKVILGVLPVFFARKELVATNEQGRY